MIRSPCSLRKALLLLVTTSALAGCGSTSNGSSPGGQDAGGDTSADSGDGGGTADASDGGTSAEAAAEAGPSYPAFKVDVPQILENQGSVLASPVVVTITWPGDTAASTWEAFDDGIGASSYWAATTAEYGVGKATSTAADHVRMARPLPASLSYTDLQTLVTAALQTADSDAGVAEAGASEGGAADAGATDPVWPAPTLDAHGNSQTIYSLFVPSTTAVTDPGTGTAFCTEGATGYHGYVTVGATNLAYSVTLECPMMGPDGIEETAAHETVESATDPYDGSGSDGYHGFDPDHLAWDLYTGFNDELGDACQYWQAAYIQETGSFPYWVQRSWSNKAALAGHDPCVPAASGAAGAYHGMTLLPSQESTLAVNLMAIGGGMTMTRGFNITIGKPLTFDVGFFSDAQTGPWTIAVDFPTTLQTFDASFMPLGNGAGTAKLSKTSGQNGDKATVTVTSTAKGEGGFQVIAITWDPPTASGFTPRYLPVLLLDH